MRQGRVGFTRFFLSHSRGTVLLAVLVGVVAGLSSTALMAHISVRVVSAGEGGPGVWGFAGLAALVLVSMTLSGVLSTYLSQRTTYELRMHLCGQLLNSPLRRVEETGNHRIVAALTQDIRVLMDAFLRIPQFCINLAIVCGCLGYLGYLSPRMLLALVGLLVVGVVTYVIPQKRARRYFKLAREEWDAQVFQFRALTDGAKELKLHGPRRAAFFYDVLRPTARSLRRYNSIGGNIYALLGSWSQVWYFVVIGLILYAMPALVGEVRPEVLTGYAITVLYMAGPMGSLVGIVPSLVSADISLRKLSRLGLSLDSAPAEQDLVKQPPALPEWSRMELVGVTHSYYREKEDGAFTLGPIDLTLGRGELLFLVGGNGSGKTTLVKLLTGLYAPDSGEIRVDGEPVAEEDRDSFRQYFSAVFSDFFLFEQLLGLSGADLDEQARKYVSELHLDHKVSVEGGKFSTTELSQGQRKRLALLGAYLEDRSVYVFDEWAADQDPLFKDIFYYQLLPDLKARGKTVVVISHDDRYFHVADRVVKLDYGKLCYDDGPAPAAGIAVEAFGRPEAAALEDSSLN